MNHLVRIITALLMFIVLFSRCFGKSEFLVVPEILDMGEVWEGDILHATFEIANTGSETIEFKTPKASCSCVNIKLSRSILPCKKVAVLDTDITKNRQSHHSRQAEDIDF